MNTKNTIYKEKLLRLYKNPKNYGELEDYDLKEKGYNPYCGDKIQIFLKIHNNIVTEISWEGRGCVISQVAASLVTSKIKNKKVVKLKQLDKNAVLEMFDVTISFAREKCALLPLNTVKKLDV